ELKRAARKAGTRLDVPWSDLTDEERTFVVDGDDAYDGIRGFFRWLERKKYKVHVRVFLSRYRGYLTCPDCGGARLRREARDVQVAGRTIDRVSALTVQQAQGFFSGLQLTEKEQVIADKVLREIRKRLAILSDVDLGLGAGEQGGRVVFSGTLAGLMHEARSLTSKYLRQELAIPVPPARRRGTGQKIKLTGASEHNLKNVDVGIPLNTLTVVTGV